MSELTRPRPSPATSAAKCDSPPGFQDLGAAGVFADYLVLDAWVANQDRHDRNWAVLERADAHARRRLAASFDHTSSLGFNLLDAARRRILRDRAGIETWVARGRAGQCEHDPEEKSAIPSLVHSRITPFGCSVHRSSATGWRGSARSTHPMWSPWSREYPDCRGAWTGRGRHRACQRGRCSCASPAAGPTPPGRRAAGIPAHDGAQAGDVRRVEPRLLKVPVLDAGGLT